MDRSLGALLAPKSIAVVGASDDFGRIGGMLIKYLLKFGYRGKIYPVNPKYEEIAGIQCYPNVRNLPEKADTALIAVAAKLVPESLRECAERGIKTAIVYSAGFAETGGEGRRKQEELREIIRQGEMKVCGPNCIGIVNFTEDIAMSFSGFLEADRLVSGNVGFVSESGALGGSIVNRAQDRNIGFSYFISTGNEADLDLTDFMAFLVDDANTQVIMAYVEGIRDIAKFARVAKRALELGKPIVLLKVGETEGGKRVAATHTGSLTGSDAVYSAAFEQYGVIRVEDYDDLIETAMLFSKSKLPKGNRMGILTGTGGGAIILADKIVKHGLSLPPLSQFTQEQLSQKVESFATVGNPMDLTGQLYSQPETFKNVIQLFAQDENIDIVTVAISMVPGERAKARATYIIDAAKAVDKPFVSWWAAGELSEPAFKLLDESEVTLFKSPERCIKAVKSAVTYSQMREKLLVRDKGALPVSIDCRKAETLFGISGQILTEHETKLLLASYGIPVTREEVATSAAQAADIAGKIGYPVALKVNSRQITHKSEAGGIRLNLASKSAVIKAYSEILANYQKYAPKAKIEGVLVQEMAKGGTEVIIGISRDPDFGLVLMFGLGGILVEILKDVSMRLLPITRRDAEEMVRGIKGYQVLAGARGKPRADIEAIIDLLLKVSNLASDWGDSISELDLNPVVVFEDGQGAKVLDALCVKRSN